MCYSHLFSVTPRVCAVEHAILQEVGHLFVDDRDYIQHRILTTSLTRDSSPASTPRPLSRPTTSHTATQQLSRQLLCSDNG